MLASTAVTVPPVLAHPLTEAHQIPLSPAVAATLGVTLVLAAVALWPGPARERRRDVERTESWTAVLSPTLVAGRVVGLALLALAVVAGRVGPDASNRNIATALVIGAAWPLLLAGSAIVGPVWRALDPWDTLARPLVRGERSEPSAHVYPAAVVAAAWCWYLVAYRHALSPRAVGTALAVYTITTLGAVLVVGRERWLSRGEVFGILFGWLARLPRGRLPSWAPPAGAEIVLGALAGGLTFGLVSRSELWLTQRLVQEAELLLTLGVVGSSALGAVAAWAISRWAAAQGAAGSVAAAAVPAVASIAIALALNANRLTNSIQFVVVLASDPFGLGWDLFGTRDLVIRQPYGARGQALAQALVLLAGHVAGAAVLARRADLLARRPAALWLAGTLALSVIAVTMLPLGQGVSGT